MKYKVIDPIEPEKVRAVNEDIDVLKWRIQYNLGSIHSVDRFVKCLDKQFGTSVEMMCREAFGPAPWYYDYWLRDHYEQYKWYSIHVILTTDEQLTYMSLKYPDKLIRVGDTNPAC